MPNSRSLVQLTMFFGLHVTPLTLSSNAIAAFDAGHEGDVLEWNAVDDAERMRVDQYHWK